MKKIFKGVAALSLPALLVASCAREVVETNGDGENLLNYGIATGKQTLDTRATETEIEDLYDGFTVVTHDGTNTNSYTVEHSETADPVMGSWIYNDGTPILHPAGTLYHYAAWPAVLTTAAAVPSLSYTADGNTDLVAAATTSAQNSPTASLTFKHILSQINFAVLGLDNYTVTINSIELDDIADTGNYTFTQGGMGIWNGTPALTDSGEHTYDLTGVTTTATSTSEPTSLKSDSNALMLMPQTFTAGEGGSFTFTFSMTGPGGFTTGGTQSIEFGSFDIKTWAPGTRYLYVITFTAPTVIQYSVTAVDEWDDTTEEEPA